MKKKKIVTIGGGTGSAAVLKGLVMAGIQSKYNISAVVGMADSGSSSGRLRSEQGFLPPGDILKALLALSPEDYAYPLLTARFGKTVPELEGHSVGNILISYLGEHLHGDFLNSIKGMQEILHCRGEVLPAYLGQVTLVAETNKREIRGEGKIEEWFYDGNLCDFEILCGVRLEPAPQLVSEAADRIKHADLVVIGPGSIYTSLVAVLMVKGMKEALANCRIVYVVNLTTHPKENPNWPASMFVENIERYAGRKVDYVIVNNSLPGGLAKEYAAQGCFPVELDIKGGWNNRRVITANLVSPEARLVRHDPERLAHILSVLE